MPACSAPPEGHDHRTLDLTLRACERIVRPSARGRTDGRFAHKLSRAFAYLSNYPAGKRGLASDLNGLFSGVCGLSPRERPLGLRRYIIALFKGAEVDLVALGKRLPDRLDDAETLARHAAAVEEDRNAAGKGCDWRLTTADARIELAKLYPAIQER